MHLCRCALRRATLVLSLVSSAAMPRAFAQTPAGELLEAAPAPLVRVAFTAAPGKWTPELPRLAAVLELLLSSRGLRVEGREVLAPGVVTVVGRSTTPARFTSRALRALLSEPQLAAWPGLQVLLSDADPERPAWSLAGELAFTLRKPAAVTRSSLDLARELAKRHLGQRGTPDACADDMLRRLDLRLLYERPSEREPKKLELRFAVRCFAPKPEPLETARWLALFAPATAVELGLQVDAGDAVARSVRAAPASATAAQVQALARAASAGACDARFARFASATPFRRAEDLSFVGSARGFDASAFLSLRAERDALGNAALAWKLTPVAALRAASADAQATWQLVVHGEVWGSVRSSELAAGEGVLYGSFETSDVELAARAFAPLDPPALWIAR